MSVFALVRRGFEDSQHLIWATLAWWFLHIVISIFGQGIMAVISQGRDSSLRSAASTSLVFLTLFSIYSTFWLLIYGGILGFLKRSDENAHLSWGNFFQEGRRWFWSLAKTTFLLWALLLGLTLLFAAAGGLAVTISPAIGLINAVVMVVVLSVSVILFIYAPICLVQDELGALEALKGSIRFARDHFWRTFQILLVAAALGALLALVLLGVLWAAGQLPRGGTRQLPLPAAVIMDGFSAYLMVFLTSSLFAFYRESRLASAP